MSIYAKIRGILAIFVMNLGDFDKSIFLLRSVDFLEQEYFWQASDCLSRKIFLGSCRAHCDSTKNTKVWNLSKFYTKQEKYTISLSISSDFDKMNFLLRSVDLLELEYFWQVSDCLSRKIFWDHAEPIVIVPKTQKSEICLSFIQNRRNIPFHCQYRVILTKWIFSSDQ